MKLHLTTVSIFILNVLSFMPGTAWAQDDMKDMPGMAPEAEPAPAKETMTQEEMDAMPGMKPAKPAPKDDMEGMPGMEKPAASKDNAMDAMPGMKPDKPAPKDDMEGMSGMEKPGAANDKAMDAMPGMEPDGAATPSQMSEPGITILRPPQKWVPPSGDNRSTELLSRSELEEHMNPLPPPVMDSMFHSFSLFELLESRANSSGPDTFAWDFVGWYGGDFNRLWVKTEGELDLGSSNSGTGDVQFLYGRMIAPFWDLQAGVRVNGNLGSGLDGNSRTYGVIGLQGLAPYRFEFEPALYISDRGEVSAQLTASYDLLLTQRLILQPRFEGSVSLDGDQRFGTGDGLNDIEIGLRLRYEIRREFAPYIGVSWGRSFGDTASLARAAGEPVDNVSFVAGVRLWW